MRVPMPVWCGLPRYLGEELQSVQNRRLDIIEVPGTSLSTFNEKYVATKQELERILNDINHLDQIFHTKANTSHLYNLRSKLNSVGTPESGTQRHSRF